MSDAAMLYVTKIVSNVKGGVDCLLGPKTFIHGPNESGKSAVVNATEIALTGAASEIFGRSEVAKESDLIGHLAPGRKGELYARAFLSDGTQAVWQAGVKGAKKATHGLPPTVNKDAVFPLRAVRAAILGNAETARKFFLQFAVGAVTERDVLERIPESLHGNYRRAILQAGLADAPVDKLLLALEKSKKDARAAAARAKAGHAAANDNAQGLAPIPTDESVKALTDQYKAAKAKLDALSSAAAASGAMDRTRVQVNALAEQVAAMEAEHAKNLAALQTAEATLAATPAPATVDDTFKALVSTIDWHASLPDGYCRTCGTQVTPEHFTKRQEAARAFAANVAATADTYSHAVALRDVARMAALTSEERLGTLKTQQAAMVNALGAAQASGGPDPAAITAAEADVARFDKALKDVDVLKAQWTSSKRATENAKEAEKEAKDWADLAEACTKAIAALLDTGVVNFAAKVQSHLPPTDRFRITLREGEKAVFQFGLEKEGGLIHTAMSGAAWARVTAAIADACAPADGKLAVVVPVPGEFDPDTLSAILAAFGALRSQVIITSPIMPTVMPPGWTVIDTGKNEHRIGGDVPAPVAAPAAVKPAPAPAIAAEIVAAVEAPPSNPPALTW